MIKLISSLPSQIDSATFIRPIDKQIAIGNLLMAAENFPFLAASKEAVSGEHNIHLGTQESMVGMAQLYRTPVFSSCYPARLLLNCAPTRSPEK